MSKRARAGTTTPKAKTKAEIKKESEAKLVEDSDQTSITPTGDSDALSDYEKVRLDNIRRNEEFLSSLGLDSVKPVGSITGGGSTRSAAAQRGVTKKKPLPVGPIRRSGRVTIEKLRSDIDVAKSRGEKKEVIEQMEKDLEAMRAQKEDSLRGSYEALLAAEAPEETKRNLLDISLMEPTNGVSGDDDHDDENGSDTGNERDGKAVAKVGSKRSADPVVIEAQKAAATRDANATPSKHCEEAKKLVTVLTKIALDSGINDSHNVTAKKSSAPKKSPGGGKGSSTAVASNESKLDIANYNSRMKSLVIHENEIAKVTEARIKEVCALPTSSRLVVAAGDKTGCVGIFDVKANLDGMQGVFKYRPHVEGINHLSCRASNPTKLFTSSYDGTIRYLDLNKECFTIAFEAPEDIYDMSFYDLSFKNDDCVYIGRSDGKVSFVDLRTGKNKYVWTCDLGHKSKVNSIQAHPTDENIVVSTGGGKDGFICINDIRKCGGNNTVKPLLTLNEHTKSINAAGVSSNGQYLVSVSQDNTVRTWANFTSTATVTKSVKINHDNHTGRWLSTFKPAFDPKHPTAFCLGSMERPRMIEIFTPTISTENVVTCPLTQKIKGEWLNSVCSRNCFHPTLDIVIGANSSGRVFIARDPKLSL